MELQQRRQSTSDGLAFLFFPFYLSGVSKAVKKKIEWQYKNTFKKKLEKKSLLRDLISDFVVKDPLETSIVKFVLFFKCKSQREDTGDVFDPLDSPTALLISCWCREVIWKDEISATFCDRDYMLLYYSELDPKTSTNLRWDLDLFCRECLVCEQSQHSCENFIIGHWKMSCLISFPSPI